MPLFTYVALDEAGQTLKGAIDAGSTAEARSRLRDEGLYPTAIREYDRAASSSLLGRFTSKDRLYLTRQLSILLGAGVPLAEAFGAIIEQSDKRAILDVAVDIRERLTRGSDLAGACGGHPKVFPPAYVNMVRVGEASGTLADILGKLAALEEKQLALRQRLVSALIYPALLLLAGLGVLAILVIFVVPSIAKIFLGMGQQLPLLTRTVVAVSDTLNNYWYMFLLGIAAAGVGLIEAHRRPATRRWMDRLALRIPVWSVFRVHLAAARVSRQLGVLLEAGVPLPQSLKLVSGLIQNVLIRDALENTTKRVREGSALAAALKRSQLFPATFIHMVAVGERGGELTSVLAKVAETYDQEVDNALATVLSLLEPVIIVGLGGLVLIIVLSVLMPIVELNQFLR